VSVYSILWWRFVHQRFFDIKSLLSYLLNILDRQSRFSLFCIRALWINLFFNIKSLLSYHLNILDQQSYLQHSRSLSESVQILLSRYRFFFCMNKTIFYFVSVYSILWWRFVHQRFFDINSLLSYHLNILDRQSRFFLFYIRRFVDRPDFFQQQNILYRANKTLIRLLESDDDL